MTIPHDLHVERRAAFYAELGHFIVIWNNAENWLRYLLVGACGPSVAVDVLTAELGGAALANALRALAPTFDEESRDSIYHIVNFYNCLREYRNYYVQGIVSIGYRSGNEVLGKAYTMSIRHKYRISIDDITSEDIIKTRQETERMTKGIFALIDKLYPQEGSQVHPVLPSQEMLPLPDSLKKNFLYPLNDLPRPQ